MDSGNNDRQFNQRSLQHKAESKVADDRTSGDAGGFDELAPPPALLNPLEEIDVPKSLLALQPLHDSWNQSSDYQPVFDPSVTLHRSLEVEQYAPQFLSHQMGDLSLHSGDPDEMLASYGHSSDPQEQSIANQIPSADAFEPVVHEDWIPPCPKGDYVEPLHHVYCSSNVSPRMVYLSSFDALVEQRVDCIPQGHKFKIACESFCEDAKVVFRVRVYSLRDGKFCLEFQRRAGDAFHFHSLYHNCLRKLASENLIVLERALPPVFAPEQPVRFDPSRAPETLDLLRQMISSPFVDVSCEGLRSLCQFARQSQMHEPLFEAGVLAIFVDGLRSPNEEYRRLATAGCANLIFHHGDACRRVLESGSVDLLVDTIAQRGANGGCAEHSLQLVREMSRVLLHIAEELGSELISGVKTNAAQALRQLEQSRDFVLRSDASRLRDLVGAH